jgi:uncharacterized protein (DUF305 family)
MKKLILFAALMLVLFACNDQSTKRTEQSDTTAHTNLKGGPDSSIEGNNTSPVKRSMDHMMEAMHGMKFTGNNDIDFASMMIEHHRGAIDMANIELANGHDPDLKSFARQVIDAQNKEIEMMQNLIAKMDMSSSSNSADFQNALNSSMSVMMQDTTKVNYDIDKDFATQMIPHHESAVNMSEAYLQVADNKSLKNLAQNIISTQSKEINWLKKWLAVGTKQH